MPEEYVRNGSEDYEAWVAGGAILLDLPTPPTAPCSSLPTSAPRLVSPPLTTVHQPLREMGRVALGTALRLAAGEKLDSHHVELTTELIVRSSTAPPPRC